MNLKLRLRRVCVVSFVLIAGASAAGAQDPGTPLEIGRTVRLQSRALGETRIIDVALPRGYAENTERYPVIVVLDGEFEFEMAAAAARFYGITSMAPRAIVVGVRNTNRSRDLTPAPVTGFAAPPEVAESGGADRFLVFLGDELMPHLDGTYRTAPMRVLVGHSLGGLFALHALTKRPGSFNGYVVMEPAIWWNREHEWRSAREALRTRDARRARVMLVNTPLMDIDTTRWGGDAPMVRTLSVTGETHESMAASGILQALRVMFADFRPAAWKPGTRPVAMLERYDSLAERVGYAVPIPASAYERTIRMSIHARHFDDAERMLVRVERAFGSTPALGDLRALLSEERATPVSADFIPLEIPARRPTPAQAAAFLGHWEKTGEGSGHEITVRASADTIVVHDRIQRPDGSWDEGDRHVIQVTQAGILEWGLPWFRGIAALVVLEGRIQPDGTMRVTREPRGWVPRGPRDDMLKTEVFRKTGR